MSKISVPPLPLIDAASLHHKIEVGAVTLVDVREPSEFMGEHLPGALSMPLSQFKPAELMRQARTPIILYCRTSRRSATAGQMLLDAGIREVTHLQGGIEQWKQKGYQTAVNRRAPISMMRQVQIVAGSLVVMGTVLGALVSPWFLVLSGFVGAGLVFSGVTNSCAMAILLTKLPYNQRASL